VERHASSSSLSPLQLSFTFQPKEKNKSPSFTFTTCEEHPVVSLRQPTIFGSRPLVEGICFINLTPVLCVLPISRRARSIGPETSFQIFDRSRFTQSTQSCEIDLPSDWAGRRDQTLAFRLHPSDTSNGSVSPGHGLDALEARTFWRRSLKTREVT
jgi:hypothetical protein